MPVDRLRYEEPQPISWDETLAAFATNQPKGICSTLVAIALHDSDWRWAKDRCLEFARHPDAGVRQAAATCIGHVARIHKKLDFGAVTPVLHELLSDNEMYVRGCAEDAMDDIEVFMGVNLKRK